MRTGLAAGLCGLLVLAGCSGGTFNEIQTQATGSVAGARLTGVVHGGQQAIVGAQVYLFAAGTTGYGGAGIAGSSSNASVSLLTSGTGRTLDAGGGATNGDYYVTTDANGNFSISGDYTCSTGQQVYLYALGGNPGSGTNSAAGLMAVLGNCPAAGNFATATPYVVINEVSTVAAAYAFAGFATDATHVSSSGTALAQVGIANAFANAGNLVTLSTGVALATTPAGNGTVPQTEINTLANILAACVNSTGAGSAACTTLLPNALSGGTTGTQPSETATAAINMAHNPAANIASLYALAAATPPFGPALSAKPNDLTIALSFTGGGLSSGVSIAVDGQGDVWVANVGNGAHTNSGSNVTELSSLGAALSGSSGFSNSGVVEADGIALDTSGNAWVASYWTPYFSSEFSPAGMFLLGEGTGSTSAVAIDGSGNVWFPTGGYLYGNTSSGTSLPARINNTLNSPWGIAIDGSGSEWVTNNTGVVSKFSNSGAVLSGTNGFPAGGCCQTSYGIAIDATGNAWITNESFRANSVIELSNSGVVLSGTNGITGGGISKPVAIGLDGAGQVWIANQNSSPGSVTELSNTGSILSGSTGYQSPGFSGPNGLAIDGSGNVWVTEGVVTEFVGVATPVITPIAAGLPATPTADGSSKLGTRP